MLSNFDEKKKWNLHRILDVLYVHSFISVSNTEDILKMGEEENVRMSIISILHCLFYIPVHE